MRKTKGQKEKKSKRLWLRQRQFVNASPSRVFQALTDPSELLHWLVINAQVDARRGGTMTLDWPSGKHVTGKILEFIQDKRLKIPWTERTQVRFDLAPKEKGTVLTLTHRGYADDKWWSKNFIGHCAGWAYFLMNIKSWIEYGNDLRSDVFGHRP